MRAGLWAPPSRRAAGQSVQLLAGPGLLPFTRLRLLLRSHWKAQRAGEPQGQYHISKRVFLPLPPAPPPPFACVDFGEARVSSTPARSSWESWESGVALAAGVRRPLKPLPDVLGRLARMARLPLASSSSSLRANHFENKAALAEKIQNRRKANTWRWLSTTCGV